MLPSAPQLLAPAPRAAAAAAVSYTGPGDVVSGAIGWWGLRAYNAAVRGNNVIELRRDSDNTAQTFVSLTDGSLDVASITTFKGAANLFVRTLYDQTGHSLDFVQTTAGTQIAFTLAGLGSLPIMQPASGKRFALVAGPTQAQPFTWYIAVDRTTAVTTSQYYMSMGSNVIDFNSTTSANTIRFSSGSGGVYTAADNTWHTFMAHANGASGHLFIDGSDQGAINLGSTGMSGNLYLLTDIFNEDTQGNFVEAGIWPVGFTATNATNIDSNASTYWGI